MLLTVYRLSGLGLATTKRLNERGAYVAVIDLHLPKDDIRFTSDRLKFFKADVSNSDEVQQVTGEIANWSESSGLKIAAVVCCAGLLGPQKVCLRSTRRVIRTC